LGSLERAAELFERFAADFPESPEANDALRRLQLIRGDIAADPEGAERFLSALNCRDRGAYERAHRAVAELVAERPGRPLADDALMLLAATLADEGKTPEARDAYERLIAEHRDSVLRPEAMLATGRLCEERLADELGAVRQYQRLVREYPRSPLATQARIKLDELARPAAQAVPPATRAH
jgi:TolA-binding protein